MKREHEEVDPLADVPSDPKRPVTQPPVRLNFVNLSRIQSPSQVVNVITEAGRRTVTIISPSSAGPAPAASTASPVKIKKEQQACDSTEPTVEISRQFDLFTDFKGACDFKFTLPDKESSKCSWSYSPSLKQVFIRMNSVLLLYFEFDLRKVPTQDLFIRCVLVYYGADYRSQPVDRCTLHSYEDDPYRSAHRDPDICHCKDFNNVGHVLRCQSRNAIYCYDSNSGRHSVMVPVNQVGDVAFVFACKNSCSMGMQRRPVKMVFNLETNDGVVLARRSLHVKVCCCPKRDRDKAERDANFLASTSGSDDIRADYSTNQLDFEAIERLEAPSSPNESEHTSNNDNNDTNDIVNSDSTTPGVLRKAKDEINSIRESICEAATRLEALEKLVTGLLK